MNRATATTTSGGTREIFDVQNYPKAVEALLNVQEEHEAQTPRDLSLWVSFHVLQLSVFLFPTL